MKTNNLDFLLKKGERQQEEHEGFSDAFLKYLRYWKWFVASIIICLALAVLYLKITPPTYEVRAKILLENTSDENTSFIKSLGLFNLKNNTDNELEVLTTSFLMEQVVRKLDIYAQYYKAERYKKIELYGKDCPISIKLSDASLDNFKGRQNFTVELRPNAVYMFSGIFDNKEYRIRATSEDSLVVLPFGTIEFSSTNYEQKGFMMIDVTLENPARVADHLIGSMNVSLASQTTTVINLALRTSNAKKGIDILNTFLETYKEEDLKDKTMMAKATANYLETLLGPLGGELSDAELKVENFKQREGVTDINTESQLYVQRSGQYEQRRLELGTQIGIIKDLENYVNKSGNSDQLLPSGIGVLSTGLNALISEYNNLLLERKRLSHTATENNQVMVNLKDRTDALFRTVQSSINNEKRNLIMSQQDITAKERENAARIKSIPRYERTISDLSRQQDVKSQLYLYLLQKKDENYLNTSTVTPKFKTIGYPRSNGVPVSPERDVIYLLAFLAGVLLPFTGVSIRNILHFTVENREELRKISSVPILGEIPKSSQPNSIIIQENATDGFTEMFRLLRTNLMFVLNEPWKKVINVVSTIKGEGKTSIAINLALSLALLDKKVLILGLDIRKPKMGKFIGLDNMTGVTQYLSGQLPLTKLVRPSGIHPNLWAITSGPTPPNPNELLAKPALDELITLYRNQFDYIVIDTPPIGAVSDSLLLNRFADVNLYVVRADYTHKGDIQEANEVYNNQMLNNMYFVLNAADMRKSSSYRYGYRKRYGYGYGYYEQKRKKKVANPAPTA